MSKLRTLTAEEHDDFIGALGDEEEAEQYATEEEDYNWPDFCPVLPLCNPRLCV